MKLLDIENGILGVPSFYRPYFMQHKKINNMEAIDVYCFGHVLYEMMFGTPLHESIAENIPNCPISKFAKPFINQPALSFFSFSEHILSKILTAEACKNGLPTILELIMEPFFSFVQLKLLPTDKAHLKIPSSTKEQLKVIVVKIQDRLKDEQKMVRSQKRLVRVQELMSSEEEKRKHRNKLVGFPCFCRCTLNTVNFFV